MLMIPCPWCGERAEVEVAYGGEGGLSRPVVPGDLSDGEWADYVYFRKNPKGTHCELWHHVHGCGRYFEVVRDTVDNRVLGSAESGADIRGVADVKKV